MLGKLPADQNDGRKRSNRQHAQLLHRTYLLATTKPEPARTQNNQKRQPTMNKNRSHETKPIKTKAVSRQARQPTETQIRNDANPDRPEIQTAEGRTEVCKTRGLCRTKHLRRIKPWLWKFNILCAAVADERESCCINRAAHAAFLFVAGGVAETYKVDVKEQSCLIPNIICKPRQ